MPGTERDRDRSPRRRHSSAAHAAPRSEQASSAGEVSSSLAAVLELQRLAGNAAVTKLLTGGDDHLAGRRLAGHAPPHALQRQWLTGTKGGTRTPPRTIGSRGGTTGQNPPGNTTPQVTAPQVTTPPVTTPQVTAPTDTTAGTVTPPPDKLLTAFGKAVAKKTTIKKVRAVYAKASMDDRKRIADDATLMARAKTNLSTPDWVRMMADVGVTRTGGTVAHKTGKQADTAIRDKFKDYVAKAVKAGKSAEGNVLVLSGQDWLDAYYNEFPDEAPHGGPSDEESVTNAFTTTKDPKNVIVLNKDKGNPGTTVHEGMHFYQNDKVIDACGRDFNEGLTELFTRQVTVPMGIVRDNYDDQYGAARQLQTALGGDKKLLAAYFQGDLSSLKKAFIAFRAGKGDNKKVAAASWDKLIGHFQADEYDQAKNMCT